MDGDGQGQGADSTPGGGGQPPAAIPTARAGGSSISLWSSRWRHSLSYLTLSGGSAYDGPAGFNWVVNEWPYLQEVSPGSTLFVYLAPKGEIDFAWDGTASAYLPKHFAPDVKVTQDTTAHTYTLLSNAGGMTLSWVFYDYNSANNTGGSDKRGLFKSFTDSSGNVTNSTIDSSGKITELQKSLTDGGTTTIFSVKYDYYTSGSNQNRLQYATLRTSTNGGSSWTNLRRASYEYFDGTTAQGSLNDLKRATVQTPNGGSWDDLTSEAYRYYKGMNVSGITRSGTTATATVTSHGLANGDTVTIIGADQSDYNGTFTVSNVTTNTFDYTVANSPTTPATGSSIATTKGKGYPHALKYLVGAEAYRRMADANLDPTSATDANVAAYADKYYEYDALQRVTKQILVANCGGCGGAGGSGYTSGDTFAYTVSSNSDGYNSWKTKIVKTQPDGNTLTIYTNYADRVMLTVLEKTGSSPVQRWYHFYQYNSRGQVILEAESSAVTGFDDSHADLLNSVSSNYQYLSDSSGLIHVTDYYDTTDAGTGAVDGYVSYRKLKHGETATAVTLSKEEYSSHSDGSGNTVYMLSKHVDYPDDSTTATTIETSHSYGWYASSNKLQQHATTLPVIGTSQNGPGGSGPQRVETFDSFGNRVWLKDERGGLTRMQYDAITGLVTQRIADVNTGSITENTDPYQVPSGWSTASGFGQHLTSDLSYDSLGRITQVLGPTRVADVAGTATTLRDATWTVYVENKQLQVGSVSSNNETRVGKGYVSGGSNTLVGPVSLSRTDKSGRQVESILAKRSSGSGSLSTSDTFNQSDWQRESSTTINNAGQITQRAVANTITSGTLTLDAAAVAYDSMGRKTRELTPAGTDTTYEYDPRGHVTRVSVGIYSAGDDVVSTVTDYEYDGGSAGGDGNLTTITQYVDASTTRVTSYGYDWRNRRSSVDGEVDRYEVTTYDNLNRLTRVDRYDTTSSGHLIGRSDTKIDDRGRIYQSIAYAVDPSSGTVGNSLTTNNWFDAGGHMIKSIAAGSGKLFAKRVYDGLGRNTKTYSGHDTSESSYSDASNVSGDTIVSQSESTYDGAGNTILIATRERLHDATGTGDLTSISGSQPKARVNYRAMWYDGGGRLSATANYGTNGDSTLTRPDTAPSPSDTVLVTTTEYDDAGVAYKTVDPAGMDNRKFFDNAGRVTKVVEAWQDGSFTTGSADRDRTTEYTYNATGKVETITARNSGTGDQITHYVYGVSTSDGSDFTNKELLRAVIYPDSDDASTPLGNGTDGIYDRVEMKYNRQGELTERKDQNQTVHAYDYDKLGRMTQDRVTGFGSDIDQGVKRIARSYEVRGMLAQVTSYNNATVGSGTVLNDTKMEYNSFGQLAKEYQNNVGAVDTSTTLKVQYTYDDGSSSSNQIRKTKVTYPNGRELFYLYTDAGDTSGISDQLNRVTALATASTRGTSDANVIASYQFNGTNQLVRKDYPTPHIRLDYWGGTSGTYAGLDRFGRIASQNWVHYASGGLFSSVSDVFKVNHGYDRDGDRLYADNTVYGSASQVYSYDNLNRLTDEQQGKINSGKTGIESFWNSGNQTWTLDATGNQTAVGEDGVSGFFQNTANKANEYTARTVKGDVARAAKAYDFGGSTASDWTKPGSGDVFDVNSTNAGYLTVTTVSQDTIDSQQEPSAQAILLIGSDLGPASFSIKGQFPSGTSSGQLGLVFGYKSGADYWLRVWDMDQHVKVYHVVNGTKTAVSSVSATVTAGTALAEDWGSRRGSLEWSSYLNLTDGYPSGRVGLYTTVANVKFDYLYVYPQEQPAWSMLGRWTNFTSNGILSSGRLSMYVNGSSAQPVLLKNLRLNRFQATFAIRRESGAGNSDVKFVFGARDPDDYQAVRIYHRDTATAPDGLSVTDGKLETSVSGTGSSGNVPSLNSSSVLWARVTCDGSSTVSVRLLAQSSEPTDSNWSGVSDCFSSTAFDLSGGLVGFACANGIGSVDEFKIKSWNVSTSAYDIVEHYETFGIDGSGNVSETPTYDLAGNMTYDGVQKYTFDAWNRLKKAAHAYRDGSNNLQSGQVFDTISYDGKGRRVRKQVDNRAGTWATTYRYYYDGDSAIEVRDGSFEPSRQYVWGTQYIDELVQLTNMSWGSTGDSLGTDEVDGGTLTTYNSTGVATGTDSSSRYLLKYLWACQDANYNVMGVVNSSAVLRERYQYTPYGQRRVLFSAGTNDVGCYSPAVASRRETFSSDIDFGVVSQAYGICDVGHQGLLHDEENGQVYNRARVLAPHVGRFVQRDPMEVDGPTLYEYTGSAPITRTDLTGYGWACTCSGGLPGPPAPLTGAIFGPPPWPKRTTTGTPGTCNAILPLCPFCWGSCTWKIDWTWNPILGRWVSTATYDNCL